MRVAAGRVPRLLAACALAALLAAAGPGRLAAQAQARPAEAGGTGLPLPRFVSLKADPVNLRQGPGNDYPTAWVFQRVGLPVEVIKEFGHWRQVRDAEGTTGWVTAAALSGRRTALILPWEVKKGRPTLPSATLREGDSEDARPVAHVEAGVLANIITCNKLWCRVAVGSYRGYIEQAKLWGAYPDEEIK
jgi:SH3-like domain-containing protein